MPSRLITYHPGQARVGGVVDGGALTRRFAAIRTELAVPGDFSGPVLTEAVAAVAAVQRPDRDETDAPFLTIDPPGSMDLDQAMLLERAEGGGYRVRYAIADVPAFVRPDGSLDAETRKRGETMYLPDGRAPLHPAVLSEGAASLLPGQVRPAYIWDLALGPDAVVNGAQVYRALVRSHDRLDYVGVQRDIDAGTADERLALLREIGLARIELERARGGASLPMPEQEVTRDPDGSYHLAFRPPMAAEDWNAQISLMTGMVAADLMLRGRVGLLRTMPAPDPAAVARFRRQARALGVPWSEQVRYGDFLRGLDRSNPHHLALIHAATALFRGAGYTPIDGDAPEATTHAAVAAPYAHVTAPLRRLVDRFCLVVCEALSAGHEVPDWARAALSALPETMAESDHRASAVERACTDAVEAAALSSFVGQSFPGVVVDTGHHGMPVVQLVDPAVLAVARGAARPGAEVTVQVVSVDVADGTVDLLVAQR
jgi:exoribonuclease R